MKIKGLLFICVAAMTLAISGCGQKEPKNVDYYNPETLGFTVPKEASLDDFTWCFTPKSYDKSNDVVFTDPYAVDGVWEFATWHKDNKKSGYVKDVYWMNIKIEKKGKSGIQSNENVDPGVAADVYGYQAFKNSDEAKSAGLSGSDTASKLLEAMDNLYGDVPCHVTIIHAGREDENGSWSEIKTEKPIEFEGKYYPEHQILKVEDSKGHVIMCNDFVDNGSEQHATATYEVSKKDFILNGIGGLYRAD
ncbi:hypothetical protein [Oribacterium sp. FC2011]|uniref:hypothetical protein n=1 Tax=Oribacterium sp. FC2011 TaxID=1408311 RepID=UPI0004E2610E|nr:hypothetical protein [Oribacterium sp. FC2011]